MNIYYTTKRWILDCPMAKLQNIPTLKPDCVRVLDVVQCLIKLDKILSS